MLSKTSTKKTRFDTFLGTGGSSGCNNELAKVMSIHKNEILWSSFCASCCNTLWVIMLILYVIAQPKIKRWQSVSTDAFRPVVPGCRYINISYVDYAGYYQHRTQTSTTDSSQDARQIKAHLCRRVMDLLVEYPAEYGPFSRPIAEEGLRSGGLLPGAEKPFPGGVTKTNTFHSGIRQVEGHKQCIYAAWFSLDRTKGPSMPGWKVYGYDTKDGKDEKCTLTEETVDNICALYPPPMNYSAYDLVPCWSGSGDDAFLCSGADNEKKCVTLTNPEEYVQKGIQYEQDRSNMWAIIAIVAVLFHLMIIAVSYRYCWSNVRRSNDGFWPGPALGSCCTLACCLCATVAVNKANERCCEAQVGTGGTTGTSNIVNPLELAQQKVSTA